MIGHRVQDAVSIEDFLIPSDLQWRAASREDRAVTMLLRGSILSKILELLGFRLNEMMVLPERTKVLAYQTKEPGQIIMSEHGQ